MSDMFTHLPRPVLRVGWLTLLCLCAVGYISWGDGSGEGGGPHDGARAQGTLRSGPDDKEGGAWTNNLTGAQRMGRRTARRGCAVRGVELYSAANTRVLSAKYSNTCRRVRSALLPACVCLGRTLVSIELWRLMGSAFGPMAITEREISNFIRKICFRHVCWRIFL